METEILWPAWIIATALCVLFLALAFRAGRRHRLFADTPTSKARGVFIGQVELVGQPMCNPACRSWLAEIPCVWYRYTIEEEWERWETETYTDKEGRTRTRQVRRSGWTEIAAGGEAPAFELRDETGSVQIRPEGADIRAVKVFSVTARCGEALYSAKTDHGAIADSTGLRRFHEQALPLERALFVAGYASERTDVVAPEIAQNEAQDLFLISSVREEKVQRNYRIQFWLFGLLALPGLPVAAFVQFQDAAQPPYGWAAGLFALATLGWGIGWLWLAFNSLVRLRHRTAQAWSLIDVQLKRRAALLPRLVEVVRGLAGHEHRVQEELALLRTQTVATPPGQPGPDIDTTRTSVVGIVERYPELKANSGFLALQQTLADTETRIALARDYYNAIATHSNTRLELIPDRWIAVLAGLKPQALLGAEGFERTPVQISGLQ